MAAAAEVGGGGSGVEVEVVVAAGVDVTGNWSVEVKPALAVDTGVRVAAPSASWGVGNDVTEQATSITAHSRASPAGQEMLA